MSEKTQFPPISGRGQLRDSSYVSVLRGSCRGFRMLDTERLGEGEGKAGEGSRVAPGTDF